MGCPAVVPTTPPPSPTCPSLNPRTANTGHHAGQGEHLAGERKAKGKAGDGKPTELGTGNKARGIEEEVNRQEEQKQALAGFLFRSSHRTTNQTHTQVLKTLWTGKLLT